MDTKSVVIVDDPSLFVKAVPAITEDRYRLSSHSMISNSFLIRFSSKL